jgi:hypothetical protein
LALAAGQGQPALADQRVVAGRQRGDELLHLGRPCRRPHLLICRVRAAVGDVGPDGVGEQERFLEDHAELAAQRGQPHPGQWHATDPDLTGLRVVEAG